MPKRRPKSNPWPLLIGVIAVVVAGVYLAKPLLQSKSGSQPVLPPSTTSTTSTQAVLTLYPTSNQTASAASSHGEEGTAIPMQPTDSVNTNDPSSLIRAGTTLLEEGKIGAAIALYTRAMALDPEDPDVHFNLAMCYVKQSRGDEAEREYLKAVELDPQYVEAHNNLGTLYMARKDYAKANQHLTAALKIMPDYGKALNNMGKCLSSQNHTEEGVTYFQQAVQVDPENFEARYNLATALMLLKRPEEAIKELNDLLARNPNFEPAVRAMEIIRKKQQEQQP